jgi:DNA-binding beta-propeller fold protein YncE
MERGKVKRMAEGAVRHAAFAVAAVALLGPMAARPAQAQVSFGDRVPIILEKRNVPPAGPVIPTFRPIRLVYRQTEGEPFKKPAGISVDGETGEILVTDSGNNLVTLLSKDGVPVYTFGYNGEIPQPTKAVADKQRRILVLAGSPRKVKVFSYRGDPLGEFGFPGFDGAAQAVPTAIAVDGSGRLYIADSTSGQVLVYDSEGRLALTFGKRGDGPGTFKNVTAMTVDSSGAIYVADAQQKPAIQVFDAQGNYLRGWGEHSGGPQNVSLPAGIAVAATGQVLVLDTIRQTIAVFTSEGQYLARFGGLGVTPGSLAYPMDLAVDDAGRLYVTESLNTRVQVFEPMAERPLPRAAGRGAQEMPKRERDELRRSLGEVLKDIQK